MANAIRTERRCRPPGHRSRCRLAIVIVPSYGRDGGDDFNYVSEKFVEAGYLVLRPQPRGTLESSGLVTNITLDQLAADIAKVIDSLAGGRAIVLGHAFGTFVTKKAALNYPDKIPAIITAASGAQVVPANIAGQPEIAGNTSLPLETRLAALQLAFFAPNHDARIWLDGWYTNVLSMEHSAIIAQGDLTPFWARANTTQVLEIIPADDPFQPQVGWNTTTDLYPDRAVSTVIPDAAHALFPEQPQAVVDACLPWLAMQSSKL